jgi:hypothetical protein
MEERSPLSRVFGRAVEDLELDFSANDRPALVTALLAAGEAPAEAERWWQRPVGDRTAALLALLRESEGAEAIVLSLRCDAAGCGARLEIELPHAAFDVAPRPSETITVLRDDGAAFSLRRPTGKDLRDWRALRSASRDQALMAMLASLSVAGEPRLGDAARSAEALAEADPLVAFSVVCGCPTCGREAAHDVDLEGLVLQRLAARQRALLHEVHTLASHYGWTEREILAVTPARRARYLELIEGVA